MKNNFDRLLTERPRYAPRDLGKNNTKIRDLDDLPSKEAMRPKHTDRKELNDFLNPLIRYLNSNVGRNWDDVYSDIAQHLKGNSTLQDHIKLHLWQFVEVPKHHNSLLHPFYFFVDVDTWTLQKIDRKRRRYKKPIDPNQIIIKKNELEYHCIDGIWYKYQFRFARGEYIIYLATQNNAEVIVKDYASQRYCLLKKTSVFNNYYAWNKQQLNRTELKAYGLINCSTKR